MSNAVLYNARRKINDEFYTLYADIEKELIHYNKHFDNKVVYCNCDDPNKSNFWLYFKKNFKALKLRRLISTYYTEEYTSKCVEFDGVSTKVRNLIGNGDFRSDECLRIMNESDIIVTNPPFSLFHEYISILFDRCKKFLIIGPMMGSTYKLVFPHIKNNEMWYGVNNKSGKVNFQISNIYQHLKNSMIDDFGNKYTNFGNIRWFTNLNFDKTAQPLQLNQLYSPEKYPEYDNYFAININKYSQIPSDYFGVMGVPITFLDHYCPNQFEILGISQTWDNSKECKLLKKCKNASSPVLHGKKMFARIFIKRKI